jgi:hypothetical protein
MLRSTNLKCRAVKGLGPDLVVASRLPAPLAHHASSCLRCQAEVARYRRLRRELGALSELERAPHTLLGRVEQNVWAEAAEAAGNGRSARVAATVAGATAAASVMAVAMWRRARTVA